jgi:hypothetical protein
VCSMRARRAPLGPTGQASEAKRRGPECSQFPLRVMGCTHGLRVRSHSHSASRRHRNRDSPWNTTEHRYPLFVAGSSGHRRARTRRALFGLVAALEDRHDPAGKTPSSRSFVAAVHFTHRHHEINERGRHEDPLKRHRIGRFPQAPKRTLETVENVQALRQTEGTLRVRSSGGLHVF